MTAWPHTKPQHVLQLVVGHPPGADCSQELALGLLEKSPTQICPSHKPGEYWPAFINESQNLNQVSRAIAFFSSSSTSSSFTVSR